MTNYLSGLLEAYKKAWQFGMRGRDKNLMESGRCKNSCRCHNCLPFMSEEASLLEVQYLVAVQLNAKQQLSPSFICQDVVVLGSEVTSVSDLF